MVRVARWPGTTLVLAALAGCGAGTMTPADTVLTWDEMARSGASTVYDAVERLRPRWLQVRSPRTLRLPQEVVVYHGPTFLGNAQVLKSYRVDAVTHLEFLDAATASATLTGYGSRHVQGAIRIHWRAEGPPRP